MLLFSIMQVDLTNLIYYSYDALLFSNKQFGWSMDWGANMGNRHGWDSNQKGSRHGANLDRPPVDACPAGTLDSAFGATCTGLRHDHRFGCNTHFCIKKLCKVKSAIGCIFRKFSEGKDFLNLIGLRLHSWHAILYFLKIFEKPRKI
jgi:hypothetical protein